MGKHNEHNNSTIMTMEHCKLMNANFYICNVPVHV